MQLRRWVESVSVIVAIGAGGWCHAQNLVPLDPSAGFAEGINANGDVIFDSHILRGGVLSPLGSAYPMTDSGPSIFLLPMSGNAINDNGESVGSLQYHAAFRDAAGNIADLGTIAGAPLAYPYVAEALGMNNTGWVVGSGIAFGSASYRQGWYRPVGGALTKLTPPVSYSDEGAAYDINGAGLITGYYNRYGVTIYPQNVAFIFNANTSQWTELGLGTGRAINESGEVAGYLTATHCGHAFVHRNGVTTDIGTLGGLCSDARAINDHGVVAGSAQIATNPEYHAFVFNGAMQDVVNLIPLNDPFKTTAVITEARGINNQGLLVVNGFDMTNPASPVSRAWLLQIPQVYFDGGVQNFGEVPAGSTSPAKTITLTNKSNSTVVLNFTLMRGNFAETNNCPGSLASGASCVFTVTFTPPAGVAGNYTGGLTVSVNGMSFRTQATGQTPMPVALSINTSNVVADLPFTLSWSAPAGSTCWGTGNSNLQSSEPWSSTKPASGSATFTVPTAGANTIGMQCTLNGATGVATNLQFNAALPTVTTSLTPSATTVYAGTTFTLNWSSTLADECVPGGDDPAWVTAWRPANGSQVLAAPSSVNVPVQFTYTLRCVNFTNQVSATAQTVVTMNPGPPPAQPPAQPPVQQPPPTPPTQQPPQAQPPATSSGGGGGGGSLDRGLLAVLALALIAAAGSRRRGTLKLVSAR